MADAAGIISTVAECVIAGGTIAATIIAYTQLKELNRQQKISGDREKQWQTISACQRYFNDPTLLQSKKAIWVARGNGTRDKVDDPSVVKQDAIIILNYLDTIAIGVQQNVYMKQIVKDNLGAIMIDAVQRLLENGSGDFQIRKDHLPSLIAIAEEFRNKSPNHQAVR